METATMGNVVVRAKIENLSDLYSAHRGVTTSEQIRSAEVEDALVDTDATHLSLPTRIVERLGLNRGRTRRARTSGGIVDFRMCDAVRLTIQGRDCVAEVSEVPDTCPVMIGQIPLESLDFVVDLKAQRLVGNPDHGGEQMMDMF